MIKLIIIPQMKGIFITSNNTDVGKTFIACQIIAILVINKIVVAARKPIETNCQIDTKGNIIARDAKLLQQSAGNIEDIDIICPYKLGGFMSAELASRNQNITLTNVVNNCVDSDKFVVVEGAGGFYSPLLKNTLNSDLAIALGLSVVIVIEDKIGAISEALLTIEAVLKANLQVACVVLNQKTSNCSNDYLYLDNYQQLKKYTNEKIIVFDNSLNFNQAIKEVFV